MGCENVVSDGKMNGLTQTWTPRCLLQMYLYFLFSLLVECLCSSTERS